MSLEFRSVECDLCGSWFEATSVEDFSGFEWFIMNDSDRTATLDATCDECFSDVEYYSLNLPLPKDI